MNRRRLVRAGIGGLALLLWAPAALLIAAWATGRVERAYVVLDPGQDSIRRLAERHRPLLFLPPGRTSPPLLEVRWEAVRTGEGDDGAGRIDLVYWHVWEDEIHPRGPVHGLYRLFRSAYFGHPPRDIEFFQLTADPRQDGEGVVGILHETDPGAAWDEPLPEHVPCRWPRPRDAAEISAPPEPALSPTGAPIVRVITWNHLSELSDRSASELLAEGWQPVEAPLRPLDEATYRQGKYARKSQGDHRSHEHPWALPVVALGAWLLPVLVLLIGAARRRLV